MSQFLKNRLQAIRERGIYRDLPGTVNGVDFWSNDYLGLARSAKDGEIAPGQTGSTGSRLISGDRDEFHQLEQRIAAYHGNPSALLFPSGYAASLGLLSAILTRTDTIVYDELSHACCRDGIRLGHAASQRFSHNDLDSLRQQLGKARTDGQVFVLTESRFSMDGDLAPLAAIAGLCGEFGAHLIVDEAHSGGLDGEAGRGLVHEMSLQSATFATIITYGKAFGAHGAAIVGSEALRDYLINTARPFIYSTAPAAAQYVAIGRAYDRLETEHAERAGALKNNIEYFQKTMQQSHLATYLAAVAGPIQVLGLAGNGAVMRLESALRAEDLLVKGIRSPTVAAGKERLRICLHAFNTYSEIDSLVTVLRRELTTFGGSEN